MAMTCPIPHCGAELTKGDRVANFVEMACTKCPYTTMVRIVPEGQGQEQKANPFTDTPPAEYIVTAVENKESHNGGRFYHIFLKGPEGKSYLTHAYPRWAGKKVRNFEKWKRVIDLFQGGENEIRLVGAGIRILKDNIIDADSTFTLHQNEKVLI